MSPRSVPGRHGKQQRQGSCALSTTMAESRSSSCSEDWSRNCFASKVSFITRARSIWRWVAGGHAGTPIVKFELLADLPDRPAEATISFDACDNLGAMNLRGTGFAARDFEVRELHVRDGDVPRMAEVNVSGLAGFLLAKTAAAYSRRKPKDWYDIAFVLLHNDAGGPEAAAASVRERFIGEIVALQTALDDLQANFQGSDAQGSRAYVAQIHVDHPELDPEILAADAVIAVEVFLPRRAASRQLNEPSGRHTPARLPPPPPMLSPACHAWCANIIVAAERGCRCPLKRKPQSFPGAVSAEFGPQLPKLAANLAPRHPLSADLADRRLPAAELRDSD